MQCQLVHAVPGRARFRIDEPAVFLYEPGALESWLLGQAGREFQSWRGAAPERLTLSVNLSPRQLEHSDLLENIEGVLAEHSLEAEDLILGENLRRIYGL